MTAYSQANLTVRKTFNISQDNAERMQKFLSPRKQTEFVNQALEHEFARIEKAQKLKSLSAKIQTIKRVKGTEPAVDTIRRLRDERVRALSNPSVV